jgi:hypothetical protein
MADDKQGLDYFLASDAWKDTKVCDWYKVDAYVDHGWLTDQDRKLLHAYGSMAALNPNGGGGFSETDAAWSKFLQVDGEHGKDPMFTADTKAKDIPPPGYDHTPVDGKDYFNPGPQGLPDSDKIPVADPPDVPGGADGANGGPGAISVNTKALETFADNVEALRVMVADANKHTQNIDVLPGGFYVAYQLRKEIMGDGAEKPGLKNDVDQYMKKLDIELANIRDEIRKLVVDYKNTEDLNNLTADKLTAIMNESFSYINSASSNK